MSRNALQHIWNAFVSQVDRHPDHQACTFKTDTGFQSYSYEELYQRIKTFARVLKESGLSRGDRVVAIAENQPDFIVAFLAVMALDAVFIPIDHQYPVEQIQKCITHAQAETVLLSQRMLDQKAALKVQRLIVMDDKNFKEVKDQQWDQPVQAGKSDPAVIFYTSGTTQDPKGVVLTHQNLLSNVAALQKRKILQAQDVILSFLPLHHAYAFTGTLLLPLCSGLEIALCASVASVDLVKTMKETGVTIFVGVPQVFDLMAKNIQDKMKHLSVGARYGLALARPMAELFKPVAGPVLHKMMYKKIHDTFGGKVRYLISGGAKLEPRVAGQFQDWGFCILEGYGLTETAPVISLTSPKSSAKGTVGQALSGVEIKIHDPDEEGVGEVWVKGPNVMSGYLDDPGETRAVLTDDGWLKTGDLGVLSEKRELTLKGRLKELIVLSNGKNIHPEDIEQHYEKISLIKEVAVFARTGLGQTGQDELTGLIYLDEEKVQSFNQLNLHETIKWELDNFSSQLPTHQRLKGFTFVKESFPRTRLGKLKRFEIPQLYERTLSSQTVNASALAVETSMPESLEEEACRFIEENLKRQIQKTDHLELDLGLDSLNRIELLLNLQDHLGLNMNEDQAMGFFSCQTIDDLLMKLNQFFGESRPARAPSGEGFKWTDVFDEDISQDVKGGIKLSFHALEYTFNFLIACFFKVLFKVCFVYSHQNREHLPAKGPYILVANHSSFLDGLFVMAALPFHVLMQTYFIGMARFLNTAILRPFSKTLRLVSIEFNFQFMDTLKVCAYIIKQGKVLCYFPEGQRSIDGQVQEFKKGIGILIKELDVPVVPVYLDGAYRTWNRHQRWPHFARVRAVFGKPLQLKDLKIDPADDRDAYAALAEALRQEICRLQPHH